MPLDYAPPVAQIGVRKALPRLVISTAVNGVGGFASWCLQDGLLLRFAPNRITDFDWTTLFFFVAVFAVEMWVFRQWAAGPRVGWSFAATVASTIFAVVLVLFFGIPFHFAMGGHL